MRMGSLVNFWRQVATRDFSRRLCFFIVAIGFLVIYCPATSSAAGGDSPERLYELQTGTGHYDPTASSCGDGTGSNSSSVSIDNNSAEAIAKQDSKNGVTIGYALFDSTGKDLADYNATFETYGASITKAMLLVAYLNQLGSGQLTTDVQNDLTGMIEQSDDNDANTVYSLLKDPQTEVKAVAQKAGMTGFNYNDNGDKLYYLGQSQITAEDFARFFAQIDNASMFPSQNRDFALNVLSNITPNAGLLQSGLPGTIYSKEGWKPEPGGVSDPPRVTGANPNPFGPEGAPYIVNQAAQFTGNGVMYGLAVTVAGTTGEAAGEGIVNAIGSALINVTSTSPQQGQNCNCSQTTILSGKDNEEKTWNFLISLGLNDQQTAGAMGNFMQESGFDPERIQGGGDSKTPWSAGLGGYGLAQWTPGIKLNTDLANAKISGAAYELATQLELVKWELTNTTPVGVSNYIKALEQIKDAAAAALSFDTNFEGGTDPGGIRQTYAQQILQKYAGKTSTNTPGATGGCAQNPGCNGATGDTEILCNAKRFDPASYSESPQGDHEPGGNPQWIKEVCPAAGNSATSSQGKITPSCYVDCSGLVNISVYLSFGYNLNENTFGEIAASQPGANPRLWKQVAFSQIQAGDLIQPGEYGGNHVEIVDHVVGHTIYTFGAHTDQVPQPSQVGPASYTYSPGDGDVFLHWIGPTS